MIKALVHVLDTQIAYGMGFSLSLIEASGTELASAHTIFSTVATTMRGTQQIYNDIANNIITERFPAAETEGIEFKLDELNPEDELIAAQRKKLYAESAEIMDNMSVDRESINTFINRNIDEELTFMESEPVDEAAEEVVEAMIRYRDLETDDAESE
jgi:hypothetical protein